jgi:hypothetical protein
MELSLKTTLPLAFIIYIILDRSTVVECGASVGYLNSLRKYYPSRMLRHVALVRTNAGIFSQRASVASYS